MPTRRDAGSAGLEQPSLALVRAVTRLLGPLVRLLIAKGITFTYLSNLLKTVYVAEAHKALKETAETPTVSRLSVITGLQRKDINRIMSEPPPQKSAPPAVSLGARLIGIWTGDKRFRTKAGAPAPLARASDKPKQQSFDQLVRAISTDVSPRVILDEWLRLGVVAVNADGLIQLNANAFVPQRGFDEKAYYLGRNVAGHIAAVVQNLTEGQDPCFERAVYYDKLTPDSLRLLQDRAREHGMKALLALNQDALERADADAGKPDATQRMAMGLYYFQGADDPSGDTAKEEK